MMVTESRNDPLGFAKRTLKNLNFIEKARGDGAPNPDVHVVTQIVNSMLGLIVFPHASQFDPTAEKIFKAVEAKQISELDPRLGKWDIQKDCYKEKCETLGRLICHIRNGASHRHIRFSSDSLIPRCVIIEIWDQNPHELSEQWEASIRADDLRSFCLAFIELLEWASTRGLDSSD